MEKKSVLGRFWWYSKKDSDHLEDLAVDGMILLKLMLQK